MIDLTKEEQEELNEIFPFEYYGTGYFREKGIPKGEKAEILHGMEAIKYLYRMCHEKK